MIAPEKLEQFARDGYLVVEDIFDPVRDFVHLLNDYQAILDGISEVLYLIGDLPSTYRELPFSDRLLKVMEEVVLGKSRETSTSIAQFFELSLPKGFPKVKIQENTPLYVGSGLFNVMRNPNLLDVVEGIIGSEIYANPLGHVRIKLPKWIMKEEQNNMRTGTTPWHQDGGVQPQLADESNTLTVWVPLTNATKENGCLQIQPKTADQTVIEHCPNEGAASIPVKALDKDRIVTLEMRPGSALFMHKLTPHASLDNETSDQLRISLDLRYHPIGDHPGIAEFPGFVARSTAHPDLVQRSAKAWENSWHETRARMAARGGLTVNPRWDGESDFCI